MLVAIANALNTILGFLSDTASATGSAMARLANIIASLGQTGDASLSTGSANAKLAYLIANLLSVEPAVVLGRSFVTGSFSTSQNTLQNALSLSGKGVLQFLIYTASVAVSGIEIKATLDSAGVDTVIDVTGLSVNGATTDLIGAASVNAVASALFTAGYFTQQQQPLNLEFKSSLLLQLKSNGTSATTIFYGYSQ